MAELAPGQPEVLGGQLAHKVDAQKEHLSHKEEVVIEQVHRHPEGEQAVTILINGFVQRPEQVREQRHHIHKVVEEHVVHRKAGKGIQHRTQHTGIWWFVVTIPLFKSYKQVNYVSDAADKDIHKNFENDAFIRDNIKEKNKTNKNPGVLRLIADAFAQIFGTIKKIATKDKKVGLFLVAFFLYIDGVGTIIDNCINIGTDLKLDSVGQVVFLLFTQIVACIGSLVFGRLSQTYKTTTLLYVCIAGYFAVCLYALTLHDLIGFGIMAFGVGCFQGSLQALSRSYFSKIIPPENSGEYFGIYDIFAKGASFLGSLVIASVKLAGGTINVAVATMAIFFAVGFVFLRLADRYDAPRHENN